MYLIFFFFLVKIKFCQPVRYKRKMQTPVRTWSYQCMQVPSVWVTTVHECWCADVIFLYNKELDKSLRLNKFRVLFCLLAVEIKNKMPTLHRHKCSHSVPNYVTKMNDSLYHHVEMLVVLCLRLLSIIICGFFVADRLWKVWFLFFHFQFNYYFCLIGILIASILFD